MNVKIVNFLCRAFPFLITVGLWRLSDSFWNPAGILAIIPIFFCSFIRYVPGFSLFSLIMCFVIDYKFETVCFWVAMYCLFYAINGFQSLIDLTRMDKNGLGAFMIFFGFTVMIQVLTNFTFINLARGMWMFVWTCALYIPTTALIKRIQHD